MRQLQLVAHGEPSDVIELARSPNRISAKGVTNNG